MLPKYAIEYSTPFRRQAEKGRYATDDPVECDRFVEELLERGFPIHAIKHEGLDLPPHEFDLIIKRAAGLLASRHICISLGIKPDEEHYRFGFAA